MNIGALAGKSTFDASKLGIVKSAMKAVGAINLAPEMGKGGYVGVKERQADAALERARKMGYESESQVRADAAARADNEQRAHRNELDRERGRQTENARTAEDVRKPAETAQRTILDGERRARGEETGDELDRDHKDQEKGKKEFLAQNEASQNMQRQRIANAVLVTDATQRAAVEDDANRELARLQVERASREPVLDASISEAKRKLEEFNEAVEEAGNQAVEGARRAAEEGLANIKTQTDALDAQKRALVGNAAKTMSAEAVAKRSGYTRLSTGMGVKQFFLSAEDFEKTLKEDPVAKRVTKASRKYNDKEASLRIVEKMRELGTSTSGTPRAAPRAATTPPTESSGEAH
jgi:hypothetical protein